MNNPEHYNQWFKFARAHPGKIILLIIILCVLVFGYNYLSSYSGEKGKQHADLSKDAIAPSLPKANDATSETSTNIKSSAQIGDIKDNQNTQININSPNPTQNINNPRIIKKEVSISANERKNNIFITRIIMKQTKGIWNQGTKFKLGVKLSGPYIDYKFIKGLPNAIVGEFRGGNPGKGLIRYETLTAPLDEDIIVEIKSESQIKVEMVAVEPSEKE